VVQQLTVRVQAAGEEENLRVKRPHTHITVEIGQVRVLTYRLEEGLPAQAIAQHADKGSFSHPDIPRHCHKFFHCTPP